VSTGHLTKGSLIVGYAHELLAEHDKTSPMSFAMTTLEDKLAETLRRIISYLPDPP